MRQGSHACLKQEIEKYSLLLVPVLQQGSITQGLEMGRGGNGEGEIRGEMGRKGGAGESDEGEGGQLQ